MFDISRQIFGDEKLADPNTIPDSEANKRLHQCVEHLGREFDAQEDCHPSYQGYICYCDGLRCQSTHLTDDLSPVCTALR
jgi:hypothetical protein